MPYNVQEQRTRCAHSEVAVNEKKCCFWQSLCIARFFFPILAIHNFCQNWQNLPPKGSQKWTLGALVPPWLVVQISGWWMEWLNVASMVVCPERSLACTPTCLLGGTIFAFLMNFIFCFPANGSVILFKMIPKFLLWFWSAALYGADLNGSLVRVSFWSPFI